MAASSSSGGGLGGDASSSSNSGRVAGASISAAATTIGSVEPRFHAPERRSRWSGCFGGFSCFGSQKGGKRIVPASCIPDGNATTSRGTGTTSAVHSNQTTALNHSPLAPPSSPASFTNSALPSTAQSPSCFLSISANSPGGPSSTMFATGPYAHETQLVSPPVFSTFTTEPSTAPLTPPPELAHLTTPSSPDVPFAKFLSSSIDLKSAGKENGMPYLSTSYAVSSDLQANYPLYPGSPSSSLISPASGTPRTGLSSPFPEQENPLQWHASLSARDSPYSRNSSSKIFGIESATSRNFILSPDSSFFYPATSAQFYLDQAQQSFSPYTAARLSVSREPDVYTNGGNRHNKTCKQESEEIESYRASFGFSADEIIPTQNYVGSSEPVDESFTMSPFPNSKTCTEQCLITEFVKAGQKMKEAPSYILNYESPKQAAVQQANGIHKIDLNAGSTGLKLTCQFEESNHFTERQHLADAEEQSYPKVLDRQFSKRNWQGKSCSDAEIEYRRARSLRETTGLLSWRNSLP